MFNILVTFVSVYEDMIASYTNVNNIANHYDFSEAKAKLISTVPCRKPLPTLSSEEKKMLYQLHGYDMDLVNAQPCEKCVLESQKLNLGTSTDVCYGSKRVRSLLNEQVGKYS